MHLDIGDRLLVTGRGGGSGHVCRVLSIWGPDGTAPYVVLRYDTGDEELLVPNEEFEVRILTHAPA